jgi:hypothetical protein
MNSLYVYETKLMEQRELVKLAEKRSLLTSTTAAGRKSSRVTGFGRIFGSVLAFVGSLAHDSRPRLRSNEEELASRGMSWQADPAYDAMLAQQIETARLQSQAGLPAVANAALARPATFSPTSVFPKRQSAASHA